MERTEGEEMDGKVLGWLEEARKGVKGDGLACWQQIEVTRFKWEWERVKMNLAVADSNRVRNVKEGGEGDDRSLSMAGLLSTKTQMKTGTLILSFLLLVLPNPVFFFFL